MKSVTKYFGGFKSNFDLEEAENYFAKETRRNKGHVHQHNSSLNIKTISHESFKI